MVIKQLLTYSNYWPTEWVDVASNAAFHTCCEPCTYSGYDSSSCYGGSSLMTTLLHSCSEIDELSGAAATQITFAYKRYQVHARGPNDPDKISSICSFLGLPSDCVVRQLGLAIALGRVSYLTIDSISTVKGPLVATTASPVPTGTSLTIPTATFSKPSVCTLRFRREYLM